MQKKMLLAVLVAMTGTPGLYAQSVVKGVEEGVVLLDRVVEFGDKTLTIFSKYRPKVAVEPGSMGAVPEGITDWSQLSGWKDPKITEQRFHVKNAYGVWVADVGYKIIHQYGAGVDGKGKFLKVMFVPSEVRMLWGWDLDLTARVDTVSNLGTKENPLAGMVVTVQGRVRSPAVDYQTSGTYILKGDGSLQIVNRPKNLDATEDAVRNISKLAERLEPLVGRAGEEARRLFSGR